MVGGHFMAFRAVNDLTSNEKTDVSAPDEVERLRKRVAELEEANAAFEARNTWYSELIERAHDMLWTVDLSGAVTFLNSACQNITGYTKQELLGKSLADMVPPENLQSVREALSQKWELEQSRQYEIQILSKNGSIVDLEVTSSLIEHGGRPAGLLAIARDVTVRKQAQEALRQSAQNFEYLFANHPMPMWVFDLKTHQFLEVNQAAAEKYGYSRREFLAMPATALRPPGDTARFLAYLDSAAPDGFGDAGHWRHLTKKWTDYRHRGILARDDVRGKEGDPLSHAGYLRAQAVRGAVAAGPQAGSSGPTGGRRGPRFQ
jgi:PAS domain S-box-containing protein